jgi:signal transduction histidine kinase
MLQVVSNLIGNALEHGTPKTPIRLRLDGSAADAVQLTIHNQGVIPGPTREVLFSPFKPRERHARGLGLGLYIVDQIVQAHGGEVKVHSDQGTGTTFTVRLPRRPG